MFIVTWDGDNHRLNFGGRKLSRSYSIRGRSGDVYKSVKIKRLYEKIKESSLLLLVLEIDLTVKDKTIHGKDLTVTLNNGLLFVALHIRAFY